MRVNFKDAFICSKTHRNFMIYNSDTMTYHSI